MKSSKITLGMVGLGYWGPNLLRNFDRLPDCYVKICCDLDLDRLAQIQKQYPDYLLARNGYEIFDGRLNGFFPASSVPILPNALEEQAEKHPSKTVYWKAALKNVLDFTHPATALCVIAVGANPVLVDVDLETCNTTADLIAIFASGDILGILLYEIFSE